MLVASLTTLIVLFQGFRIVSSGYNGLRSHCSREDGDQCGLGEPHVEMCRVV
jgi:hypothetical protein